METETYKNAKLILERFDPDSKKKIVSIQAESTDCKYIGLPEEFGIRFLVFAGAGCYTDRTLCNS